MTIKEAKEYLDLFDDNYELPVMGRLFEEKNPYLVSDDFYHCMKKLDERDMDIVDIYGQLALLGDSQDNFGDDTHHFMHNLWVLIEALQKKDESPVP